jgi:hypothetical protein
MGGSSGVGVVWGWLRGDVRAARMIEPPDDGVDDGFT